jgi:cell wall-associated NlpC family hydrolase
VKFRSWINKQLFYLALTAGVLYIAAPVTDTATLYAMDLMAGRMDTDAIGARAENIFHSFKQSRNTLDRDIGPPVDVNLDSLSLARKNIIKNASSYLGTRYVWGGNTHDGVDCSGLVQQVFLKQKINLPRTAYRQFKAGTPIKRSELLPGDLIFFHTNYRKPGPTHVGIYVGNQHFMHAPKTGAVVKTSSINRRYYRQRYMGARRVVDGS